MKDYFNDFILVNLNEKNTDLKNYFTKQKIIGNYILYFNTNKYQMGTFSLNEEKYLSIKCHNSLLPFFKYERNNIELYTPNFINIFNLGLPLSKNEDAIKEFVLFNTPVDSHTFFNETKRLTKIKEIVFPKFNKLTFKKEDVGFKEQSLYKTFLNLVEETVKNVQDLNHGILLSGGYESRINAAIAHYYDLKRKFFTWGHPDNIECLIAKKIAYELSISHNNLRIEVSKLEYIKFLEKTGYLAHMSHTHTDVAVKSIIDNFDIDIIWNGWGDINGYIPIKTSSEIFSTFIINLFHGKKLYPKGWNHDWLESLNMNNFEWYNLSISYTVNKIFNLLESLFAPLIIGQTLSAQNLSATIISPWFSNDIYESVKTEEFRNPKLIEHKYHRVLWKRKFYYLLLKKYCNTLNYIKTSQGYYPFYFNTKYYNILSPIAAIQYYHEKRRNYPFTKLNNKKFILSELRKIKEDNYSIFNINEITEIINNYDNIQKYDIYKLIQTYWLLQKFNC